MIDSNLPTSNLGENGENEFMIANDVTAGNMTGNHPIAVAFSHCNAKSICNKTTTAIACAGWQHIRWFPGAPGPGSGVVVGATAGQTFIECSPCHDRHNNAAEEALLMRGRIAAPPKPTDTSACNATSSESPVGAGRLLPIRADSRRIALPSQVIVIPNFDNRHTGSLILSNLPG